MNASNLYAIYLRKSRIDLDAERAGQGETLKRHESALLALAKQRRYPVGEIYREVVSGDTIAGRPEMQRLLSDVETGRWRGVLVMEESRLARGDTMDQGRVQQAFYYSHTLIVTPNKVFDPDSEADQEYFEFGLFMSRREYKMINRRLYRGRLASVKEGKWIGTWAPYGYRKVKLEREKGNTLEPAPGQAEVVQQIFRWFVEDDVSITSIARRLNEMGQKTAKGQMFTDQSVRTILDNPAYCGMIRCGTRKVDKIVVDGELRDYHHWAAPVEGETIFPGRHQPLISRETWEAAKKKRDAKKGPPGPKQIPLQNPFAGLIHCANCGRVIQRNAGKYGSNARLWCTYPGCKGKVGLTTVPDMERLVLESMRHRLVELDIPEMQRNRDQGEAALLRSSLESIKKEAATAAAQKSRAFDLVEQGVYTPEVFTARMEALTRTEEVLTAQAAELEHRLEELDVASRRERDLAPKIRRVIDLYPQLDSAEEKNRLLRSVVSSITYARPVHGTVDDVVLKIYYLL